MLSLREFLLKHKDEILATTEEKALALAGPRPSSDQLKQGLPLFFQQLLRILKLERPAVTKAAKDPPAASKGAGDSDEPAIAEADGRTEDAEVAATAGLHGTEMLRLGYTLSHVVHAYGAMCQSITELATKYRVPITNAGFHDINQCLDVAIAGAVTEFQSRKDSEDKTREVLHLGHLAHEMRNTLTSANISLQLIKKGTVGFAGHTGKLLEQSLRRMEALIDRSLTEVRLRVDPEVRVESGSLLMIVDQILVTAGVEAHSRNQKLEVHVDPSLVIEADQQAFHSALSNLIQNALKFTREGGKVAVRGKIVEDKVVVEVEDECGGLGSHAAADFFKAFEQRHANRTGLGLGLTIAQRAIGLNHGTLTVHDRAGKGCVFVITLPLHAHEKKNGKSADRVVAAAPTLHAHRHR